MRRSTGLALILLPLLSSPVLAQTKGFYFALERGTQTVEGVLAVDGYTTAEMRGMMAKYCKGGKIGDLTYVGKAKKRKGVLLQKFATTCAGGPLDRFKGKRTGFEIEYITSGEYAGKHLVEITGSDGSGNIVYLRETIKP